MLDTPLITIGLPLVNALIMCGLGMTLRTDDFRAVVRQPKAVGVGVLGHYLLLPVVGLIFASLFAPTPEYAIGFVLLAACPSGNCSNALTFLARGNVALAVTLTGICAVVTLASIPLLVNAAYGWFGSGIAGIRLPIVTTMLHLAAIVVLPLLAGMILRRHAPTLATTLSRWVGRFSLVFLLPLVATIAITQLDLLQIALPRLGPAAIAMCALGWMLARRTDLAIPDAITIAMEVSIQNCTLAIIIALTLLKNPAVALPAAAYGLLTFLPVGRSLVAIGRRGTTSRTGEAHP